MKIQSFNAVRRVVFGVGALKGIVSEVKRLGCSRVLVVTDPGIEAAGLLAMLVDILKAGEVAYQVYAEVEPEPRIAVVDSCLDMAKPFNPDIVVGIGGGSSLDISKITAVMLKNEGNVRDYFGIEQVPSPGLPLILVPTTAGTGSEVTSICVLSDPEHKTKAGLVSEHMFARVALLDPELTLGLPPHVTAATGMDALVHAIESYTGVRASFMTDTLNLQAITMIGGNLRRAYANGSDIEARTEMLWASCIAGMGFSNTQNGLAHAIALAIGGRFHLPHGLLTAFIIPWVMEYNVLAAPDKFANVARALGENTNGLNQMAAARQAVKAVKSLLDDVGISYRLSSYNIPRDIIPRLAEVAITKERLISNNSRKVSEKDIITLLEENYE